MQSVWYHCILFALVVLTTRTKCDVYVNNRVQRLQAYPFFSEDPLLASAFVNVKEQACQELFANVNIVNVPVPTSITTKGTVATTYAKFTPRGMKASTGVTASQNLNTLIGNIFTGKVIPRQTKSKSFKTKKIVMLHGFDSSCVEFRRLAPKLTNLGYECYIPDILGWGFSPIDAKPNSEEGGAIKSFSPQAKMQHLTSFVKTISNGEPVTVLGASLGGALSIILATETPSLVDKLVLIDAQGFIDGEGPSSLPRAIARFGVNILKSTPLRMFANYIAYKDKKLATVDAMQIGRLHCLLDSWEDASIDFLLSGGFVVSDKVSQVTQETLVLWGEQDEILEPSTAQKFVDTLPNCQLEWVPECGHVPHLEQAEFTANKIEQFLK